MIRINLIPPEYASAQAAKEQKLILGTLGGVIVAVLLLFFVVKKAQANSLKDKIKETEAELKEYQAVVDQIEDIQQKNQKLTTKKNIIVDLNKSRLLYPVFFEDLLPIIPSDVWVTSINLESQSGSSARYKLASKALSNYALATWLTNLELSKHFRNVELDAVSYSQNKSDPTSPTELNFQLTLNYQHSGPMPLEEAMTMGQ